MEILQHYIQDLGDYKNIDLVLQPKHTGTQGTEFLCS